MSLLTLTWIFSSSRFCNSCGFWQSSSVLARFLASATLGRGNVRAEERWFPELSSKGSTTAYGTQQLPIFLCNYYTYGIVIASNHLISMFLRFEATPIRLLMSQSSPSRPFTARSTTQSSFSPVSSMKVMNSFFSEARKISLGRGRINFPHISVFHSEKALISAISVSTMLSLIISVGISLRCFSILARMQWILSYSSTFKWQQVSQSSGLNLRESLIAQWLYLSIKQGLQQAIKMTQKKVQAALATLGVSEPMYQRQWSINGASWLPLITIDGLQMKNRLLRPMKSSSRKLSLIEACSLQRWMKHCQQKLRQMLSKGYKYWERVKTVTATQTRQTQEETGQVLKASMTWWKMVQKNYQKSERRQRMRYFIPLTAFSISLFSSELVESAQVSHLMKNGRLTRTNSLTTPLCFCWMRWSSLSTLTQAISESMQSFFLLLFSGCASMESLRKISVESRCFSMVLLLQQMI